MRDEALPVAAVGAEAFEAAAAITSEWAQSRALRGLARRLPGGCLPRALELARAMRTPSLRARTLMALTLAAPADERPALLREAGAAIDAISAPTDRVSPLTALAGYLGAAAGAHAAQRALEDSAAIQDDYERGWAIAALAEHLPPEDRLRALRTVRAIRDDGARSGALAELARWLPEGVEDDVLDEALRAARGIAEADTRARTLAGMLERLPEEDRAAAAYEAMEAARSGEALGWARVLRWAAPHLPGLARREAQAYAETVTDPEAQAEALLALLPTVAETERGELAGRALEAASATRDEWTRVALIGRLAPQLEAAQRAWALDSARALSDPWARADLLGDLAEGLPAAERGRVLLEALRAARAAPSAWTRARALSGVAARWS